MLFQSYLFLLSKLEIFNILKELLNMLLLKFWHIYTYIDNLWAWMEMVLFLK